VDLSPIRRTNRTDQPPCTISPSTPEPLKKYPVCYAVELKPARSESGAMSSGDIREREPSRTNPITIPRPGSDAVAVSGMSVTA